MSIPTHTLTYPTNPPFSVQIGYGLRKQAGPLLAQVIKPGALMLVADSTVDALYGAEVAHSLTDAGFTVHRHSFPAGEAHKNTEELVRLWQALAEQGLSRSDCLVALGGGVTGDLAGLAAATYLRGISYVQMPTTVIASLDSCFGGKTAVNLPTGKNLVGSFTQPALILCDCECWQTLPAEIYRDGLAEAVKYGALASNLLLKELQDGSYKNDIAEFIQYCLQIKARYVIGDEHDQDQRQMLNFGHTVGHAIERCSGYRISHGQAVAAGMAIISRSALAHGLCTKEIVQDILKTLRQLDLPTATGYSAQELATAALADKKRRGKEITLVVPKSLQTCRLYTLPVEQLEAFIASGLEELPC